MILGDRMVYLPDYAKLSKADVGKVQKLEKEIGIVLLAFEPNQYAELSAEKLKKLKAAEKELGVTVIAYK